MEPYKETDGSYYSYKLYSDNIKSGMDLIKDMTQLKGGKKISRYSNGLSKYNRKSRKQRLYKTHLSRRYRFSKNKLSKKNRHPKKTYNHHKKKHGRRKCNTSYSKSPA